MILKKIKQLLKRKYGVFKDYYSNTYYLSIGENCLTDNVLARHEVKSFSTPYSHGRSNLDYAIILEKENYYNLLKLEHLYFAYLGEKKVVRNKHYVETNKIYHDLHQNGFEFTHHDVINNDAQKTSYERKILRLQSINKSKKLVFVYHYRRNKNMDFELLIKKANEFLGYYQLRNIKCKFIFFTQEIISNIEERNILRIHNSQYVKGYILRTLDLWEGENQDLFWARKDDDLFAKMIKEIK